MVLLCIKILSLCLFRALSLSIYIYIYISVCVCVCDLIRSFTSHSISDQSNDCYESPEI